MVVIYFVLWGDVNTESVSDLVPNAAAAYGIASDI